MEATNLQLMEGHSAALAAEWPGDQRLRFYLPAKRVLDFTASLVLPISLFPLLVLVALAIKVWSPGPVFYRW